MNLTSEDIKLYISSREGYKEKKKREWHTFSQITPTAPVAAMTASLARSRRKSPMLLSAATRRALLTKMLNAWNNIP